MSPKIAIPFVAIGIGLVSFARSEQGKPVDASLVEIEGVLTRFRKAAMETSKTEWVDNVGSDLLALRTADGKIVPIWPTAFGRFFYKDPVLIGKTLVVTGLVRPNVPGIEPIKVQRKKVGKLHDIFYWCDVCAIKMHHCSACTCCQGEVELREVPVK